MASHAHTRGRVSVEQPFRPVLGGWVRTTLDALLLFRAAQIGRITAMPRRLSDLEKVQCIRSGAIFVFEEKRSGIKRWTDSREWSPSRILHNFLIYRELDPNRPDRTSKGTCHAVGVSQANARAGQARRPSTGHTENDAVMRDLVGSLREHTDFQRNGLMKKTITIGFEVGTIRERSWHIVSYYKPDDILNGTLQPVYRLPGFHDIHPGHEWLDPTHFRFPPKITFDDLGCRHYIGEADDEPSPTDPTHRLMPLRPPVTAAALAAKERGISNDSHRRRKHGRYAPYTRPSLSSHNSSTSLSSAATDVTMMSGSGSGTTDSIDLPALTPSSPSSDLSGPTSDYGAQSAPFYYGHGVPYHPYQAGSLASGSELPSMPAVDHSAAPRPSPYYPTGCWPTNMPPTTEGKAGVNQLQLQVFPYGMYAPFQQVGYGTTYAPAYAEYYQPHGAEEAGALPSPTSGM
ncbi:hypothetical protein DACRYDRAFT_24722 [Dacryopinax primogenitus]|uniref:Gti1/Pac2 family-domain-containing protein n=1 Tax=Dacryopinax primogenitus (strain DJM 731) TaxID=1858805 RepID=M5FSQ6_DACPD|nr:uncharacterized protein DACRYDRAFT_24722 [Dacryopinax primogenitus]EJT98264.1 hypothetical protein DACRYDRAFT_24722 [Dacryopinax primogenitus]